MVAILSRQINKYLAEISLLLSYARYTYYKYSQTEYLCVTFPAGKKKADIWMFFAVTCCGPL